MKRRSTRTRRTTNSETALIPVESRFAGGGAPHQISYGVLHGSPVLKNRVHLLGNRHFDPGSMGQSDRSFGGEHAFCDHAVHPRDDVIQLAPVSQFDANAPVSREAAGAGEDQVAESGQSGHGFRSAPARDYQPRDLSQPPRDERGDGVVSEVKAK